MITVEESIYEYDEERHIRQMREKGMEQRVPILRKPELS